MCKFLVNSVELIKCCLDIRSKVELKLMWQDSPILVFDKHSHSEKLKEKTLIEVFATLEFKIPSSLTRNKMAFQGESISY